jgi:hypothetical protein
MDDYIGLVARGRPHQLLSIKQVGRDIIASSASECFDLVSSQVKGGDEMPAKDAACPGDQNCCRVGHV